MSDEKTGEQGEWGPYQLLRPCDEVSPRLGRLYESRSQRTGRPALTLFPQDSVQWQPVGPWRGWISFDPGSNSVSLELERRPGSEQVMEYVNLFTLMTEAGQEVEDSPQVSAHLAGGPPSRRERWASRARQVAGSRGGRVAMGLAVLVLGGGLWLSFAEGRRPAEPADSTTAFLTDLQFDAPGSANLMGPRGQAVAYPLPSKPFHNQAKPPCANPSGEVEINGGCWMELAKKPPCGARSAEHKDKCYVPMNKDRDELPQSNNP